MSELEDNVYTLSFLSYLKERNYFILIFFLNPYTLTLQDT